MPPLKVLIGVTGSVATIKLSELLEALRSRNVEVKVIATKGALPFLPADRGALLDEDEWGHWHQIGDPILHIETSVFRAWDWKDSAKRVILCPAMNTAMWDNPITEHHIERINALYPAINWIMPQSKHLACGDEGMGAMAAVTSIAAEIIK